MGQSVHKRASSMSRMNEWSGGDVLGQSTQCNASEGALLTHRARRRRRLMQACAAVVIASSAPPAIVHAKNWIGPTANWSVSGSWSPAGVPASADDVTIALTGATSGTIT